MLGACRKRHAHALGGVDGCGLFEPSSLEKVCEACGCHRSFHVIPTTGEPSVSELTSFANLTSELPHVAMEEPPSRVEIASAIYSLASSRHSDTTSSCSTRTSKSDGTAHINIIPGNNRKTGPAADALTSFPEYPDGNMRMEIIAHDLDDYGTTGWSMAYVSQWKGKTDKNREGTREAREK